MLFTLFHALKLNEALAPPRRSTNTENEHQQREEEEDESHSANFRKGELELERPSNSKEDDGEEEADENTNLSEVSSTSLSLPLVLPTSSTLVSPTRSSLRTQQSRRQPLAAAAASMGTPTRTAAQVAQSSSSVDAVHTNDMSYLKKMTTSSNAKPQITSNKNNDTEAMRVDADNNKSTTSAPKYQRPSKVSAPSSGMFKGFWQMVAPDPNADIEEEGVEYTDLDKNILSTETAEHATSPVLVDEQDGENIDNIAEKDGTKSSEEQAPTIINSSIVPHTKEEVPSPTSPVSSPSYSSPDTVDTTPTTNSTATSNDASNDNDSDNEDKEEENDEILVLARIEEVWKHVRITCDAYAEGIAAGNERWDDYDNLYRLCDKLSTIKQKKELRNMLIEHPELLTIRNTYKQQNVEIGHSPLHAAARSGNLDATQVLMEVSRKENYALSCKDRNMAGQTALHLAAASENPVPALIDFLKDCWKEETGVEPIGPDAPMDLKGRTPLGVTYHTINNFSQAKKENLADIEKSLFSPGDNSVCASTPGTTNRKKRGCRRRGNKNTPYKGTLLSIKSDNRLNVVIPKSKNTGRMQNTNVMYVVVGIQGRRYSMEDATNVFCPLIDARKQLAASSTMTTYNDFENQSALFVVADGHSDGQRMSSFVADKFPLKLLESDSWKELVSTSSDVVSAPSTSDSSNNFRLLMKNAFLETCSKVEQSIRDGSEPDDSTYFDGVVGKRKATGGSTCVAALVTHNHFYVCNVGDSRAILIKSNDNKEEEHKQPLEDGENKKNNNNDNDETTNTIRNPPCRAIALSSDHKPSLPTERARIENAGFDILLSEEEATTTIYVEDDGNNNETIITNITAPTWGKIKFTDFRGKDSKLACSRGFGDYECKSNATLGINEQAVIAVPDMIVQKRDPTNDLFLVVACDGIFDAMTNDDVADFLYNKTIELSGGVEKIKNISDINMSTDLLDKITHELLLECYYRNSEDNLTAIVCWLGELVSNVDNSNDDNVADDTGTKNDEETLTMTNLVSKFEQEL